MMAKIQNGAVVQYPYSITQLRRDNPETSFPKHFSAAALADWGVVLVAQPDAPAYSAQTQELLLSEAPVLVGSSWTLVWTVREKTPEEIGYYDDMVAKNVRLKRSDMLADSDWTQVADAPVDATAWATYRQALRDITGHVNFPYLTEADWPVVGVEAV